jgi:hypothetical protein
MAINRELMHFRIAGSDHIERKQTAQSQSLARDKACAAARALTFMDATRLRPSRSHSRVHPNGSSNGVPYGSHKSAWFDTATRRYLLIDEPYVVNTMHEAKRLAWAQSHGFEIARSPWAGMYSPDNGSWMYLIADANRGVPLAPVLKALSELPPPITQASWDGESAPISPIFVSPGAISESKAFHEAHSPKPERKKGPIQTAGYVLRILANVTDDSGPS